MLTLPVEEWVGNAAAVVSGVWGAVTRRSEQSGYSRTAIYTHAQRVVQAVANEQATGISYEALWAENERLRAETETLWQAWSGVMKITPPSVVCSSGKVVCFYSYWLDSKSRFFGHIPSP